MKGLCQRIPFSQWQIYKAIHRDFDKMPCRKSGKRILFDMEEVYDWYDNLPKAEQ
jgi:hypothetical protein